MDDVIPRLKAAAEFDENEARKEHDRFTHINGMRYKSHELAAYMARWQQKQMLPLIDAMAEVIAMQDERMAKAEAYLDSLAFIPANSRMRELDEDTWERAMFERDEIYAARSAARERLKGWV